MMPKFRKKPVVVEAVQFNPTGGAHAVQGRGFRATEYSGETFMGYPVYTDENGPHVYLKTAGGLARADAGDWIIAEGGDWIIKEPDGRGFYPCKPDIFEATYDPVSDE